MSTNDLDPALSIILKVPLWSQRVIYIKGSMLNNDDLKRAQLANAKACFILASRNYKDQNAADHHSILRSWAIKDYAPHVPQYVHLFKAENKMYVSHVGNLYNNNST